MSLQISGSIAAKVRAVPTTTSVSLSLFVPHGERETEAHRIATIAARNWQSGRRTGRIGVRAAD